MFVNQPTLKSLVLSCVVLATACSDQSFKSGGGGPAPQPSPTPNEAPAQPLQVTQRFPGKPAVAQKVDIVFAVDTSRSMVEEKAMLEQNMGRFLAKFLAADPLLDYQLFLIGQGFNFGNTLSGDRVTFVNRTVGSRNSLEIALNFLSGAFSAPRLPRSDAALEMVFVTDDDAGPSTSGRPFPIGIEAGVDAAAFRTGLKALRNGSAEAPVRVNGFIGLNRGVNSPTCRIENVGTQYQALASDPEYAGLIQDLCTSDWARLFDKLGESIQSRGTQEFVLSSKPDRTKGIKVLLGGVEVSAESYKYDELKNAILFLQGKGPSSSEVIEVVYTPSNSSGLASIQ